MADGNAMADIRGLDIDKLAKGFADEENVFKNFVTVSPTKAREMRWYQKTAGFLDSVDTTGITASQIANTSTKSLPVVVEQTWTRNTSYVREYKVESPLITEADIKDSDIDILGGNVRDLVRAVARQVDSRIYNVITESQSPSNILNTAATGNGWDDTSNGNPVLDIMNGQQKIRSQSYNSNELILVMNPIEHKHLLNYLITVKGSSIPQFSSTQITKHVVMEILGNNVIVSENAVTDSVAQWIPNRSATWKTFEAIQSVVIVEPLIGRKIRVKESGECLLTDPKSVHLITDTIT
tara:strand:+ start:756 stop:1640 length:885 start_codon:yes stop_codon:yes gene_type:complete